MKIEFHVKAAAFTLPPALYWFIDARFSSYYISLPPFYSSCPMEILIIENMKSYLQFITSWLLCRCDLNMGLSFSPVMMVFDCNSNGFAWFWSWLKSFMLIFISIRGRSRIFSWHGVFSVSYIHTPFFAQWDLSMFHQSYLFTVGSSAMWWISLVHFFITSQGQAKRMNWKISTHTAK